MRWGGVALFLSLLAGCQSSGTVALPDKNASATIQPNHSADQQGHAGGNAAPQVVAAVGSPCIGAIGTGPVETRTVGSTTWERNGSTLKQIAPATDDTLVIGVLSDIKEDSDDNLANIAAFGQWFKANHADIIVVDGDAGETREGLIRVWGTIAKLGLPTFVTIGNREGTADYQQAMFAVGHDYNNIFDMTVLRRIDTAQADLVSMPGYFNPAYMHAKDGCIHTAADVAALAPVIKACDSPVVLISHGGPLQKGKVAIDRTSQGDNVGAPSLTALIGEHKIPFGIFGNIHEAGGKATDMEGQQILAQKTWETHMYLNPGPVDSVRWMMNDGTESIGMAGLMQIKDGKAQYQIMRASSPSSAPLAAKSIGPAGHGRAAPTAH